MTRARPMPMSRAASTWQTARASPCPPTSVSRAARDRSSRNGHHEDDDPRLGEELRIRAVTRGEEKLREVFARRTETAECGDEA